MSSRQPERGPGFRGGESHGSELLYSTQPRSMEIEFVPQQRCPSPHFPNTPAFHPSVLPCLLQDAGPTCLHLSS